MIKAASMALGAILAFASGTPAQASDRAEILSSIAAQRLPLDRLVDGGFTGAGWNRLVADAAGAQFTMVGEQHGSGSIAEFETALHRELAQHGYTHNALEVGAHSTRFAERLVRSGRGKLAAYVAAPGHGFTLPFLFFAEEAAMTEQMVALSPDREQALWGLDQEFIGGGALHADLLAEFARTPGQEEAVETFRAAAAKDPLYSGKLDDGALAPLRAAFRGNAPALRLIDDLAASAAIYRPFVVRGAGDVYPANLARETMMKHNFLAAFASAERRMKSPPKVFFKFGGNHAMRGFSDTNVPALANFVAEWGTARGLRLVNLFVECDGGEAMNPQTNKPTACEPYFSKDSVLLQAVRSGPALQLYDLRPLRARLAKWKDIDPASRKVILAFDYYVTIRNGKAATPVGSPPALAPQ